MKRYRAEVQYEDARTYHLSDRIDIGPTFTCDRFAEEDGYIEGSLRKERDGTWTAEFKDEDEE